MALSPALIPLTSRDCWPSNKVYSCCKYFCPCCPLHPHPITTSILLLCGLCRSPIKQILNLDHITLSCRYSSLTSHHMHKKVPAPPVGRKTLSGLFSAHFLQPYCLVTLPLITTFQHPWPFSCSSSIPQCENTGSLKCQILLRAT